MPAASEVKARFEEFLEQLTSAQQSLSAQNAKYTKDVKKFDDACDQRLDTFLSGFESDNIKMLQDALKAGDVDWNAPDFIAEMHSITQDYEAKASAIEKEHGAAEDIYKRLEDLHSGIKPAMLENRRTRIFGDVVDRIPKYNKTAGMLELTEERMQRDLTYMHRSLDGIKEYNEYARENGKEEITSQNFGEYKKSALWRVWNAYAYTKDPETEARLAASRCIAQRSSHFVEQDLQAYEKAISDYDRFREAKSQIEALQDIYNDLIDHQDQTLDQNSMEARLRDKIKETLGANKEFRRSFAREFGEDGTEIIAGHAKVTLLRQLQGNVASQESAVGNAIDDIEEGLGKLRRVSSYKTVRVDLDDIERSIESGTYDIDLYIGQMEDRRKRAESFSPRRTDQYDDGMYFNYLLLYVVLADSASFDSGNHDMTRDLSSQFENALPDLASLDIENFNLNTMSIPGIDIGASIDVGSSLSDISSSMPSSSDFGGGYSGGGYDGGGFSGGFDGGGGMGF